MIRNLENTRLIRLGLIVIIWIGPAFISNTHANDLDQESLTFIGNLALTQVIEEDISDRTQSNQTRSANKAPSGLFAAAQAGDLAKVKSLIAGGADLEERGQYQATPLLIAVSKGHIQVVKALIHAGADINARGKYGYSALGIAAAQGYTEVVKMLMEAGAELNFNGDKGASFLAAAAYGGDLDTVKYLLSRGADVNGTILYRKGRVLNGTPLMAAAERGKVGIALALLKAGADPNYQGDRGYTALMLAAKANQSEMVSLLLGAGAEPDQTSEDGQTALDIAKQRDSPKIVPLLETVTSQPQRAFSQEARAMTGSELVGQRESEANVMTELLQVAEVNPRRSSKFLGCFKDTKDRDLSGFWSKQRAMTTEVCLNLCREKGFAYAGTQYGSSCFCGNDFGKFGQANTCNMPCAGNRNQTCGGTWANSIYQLQAAVKQSDLLTADQAPVRETSETERPSMTQETVREPEETVDELEGLW